MSAKPDLPIEKTSDAKKTPKRVAFIKGRTSARVQTRDEEMVMTVPNLVVREIIAFELMVMALALCSLFFDAPLEWIANPEHTPNPAKAPWYFLGLQELLHYFPPVLAGVILPGMAVVALIVIPYFRVNVHRGGFRKEHPQRTLAALLVVAGVVIIVQLMYSVEAIFVPTILVVGFMLLPYFMKKESRFIGWLDSRSLSWWIMTWFVIIVVVLTAIGILFRGPEWSWVWPWKGIY